MMKLFNVIFNILSASKVTEVPSKTPEIVFEPQRFIEMLSYMGKGMLVIFVIIGVIILATMLINKVFSAKKEDK